MPSNPALGIVPIQEFLKQVIQLHIFHVLQLTIKVGQHQNKNDQDKMQELEFQSRERRKSRHEVLTKNQLQADGHGKSIKSDN